MLRSGVGLGDAHPENDLSEQLGMGEIDLSRLVDPVHQLHVLLIGTFQSEANQVERRFDHQFELSGVSDPIGELLCQFHVVPNMVP